MKKAASQHSTALETRECNLLPGSVHPRAPMTAAEAGQFWGLAQSVSHTVPGFLSTWLALQTLTR